MSVDIVNKVAERVGGEELIRLLVCIRTLELRLQEARQLIIEMRTLPVSVMLLDAIDDFIKVTGES